MKDLKMSELAKKLGFTRARVYQLADEGKIKFKENFGLKYVEAAEVKRLIKQYRKK